MGDKKRSQWGKKMMLASLERLGKMDPESRKKVAEEALKMTSSMSGKFNPMEGLASFSAGYKAGKAGTISAGEYGEAQFDEERDKKVREYAEANMSEWLQAGEELVYSERLDSWKKRLESSAKGEVHGFDITNAIEIMRMLDSDVDVKAVVETYKTRGAFGGYVSKLVLEFSKKGPEYMEQLMSAVGMELTPQMKQMLDTLKTQNRQYAENELARNREIKADKTEQLTRVSSQLDELSAQNTGKAANQAVQE